MPTPAYSGRGQPPVKRGWLSGLTSWWNNLTPDYVTCHVDGCSDGDVIGYPGAPSGAPGQLVDPSGSPSTTTEPARDCTPGAVDR